ncbi:MarR family winged helix-turn-helix transcriptional regulator [Actinomadura algeriensis]|uniref:DNA-binding MarR family transcriptional regulator n=1 Tax=Actinomadura algeriensis TaxID=1679523 RepID=A0ABR9K040_9ACTN|nr:MarR family transcriptional regulator [Actinomadura algeriensis]MBE1536098.1 DNA-binding MarR family transcriptional regulator [Actinomadura algeriensis]
MTDPARTLPRLFAERGRWFEEALFASMERAGERPVTAAQAAVFANLDDGGTSISELARRIGVARQTAHQAVHGLIGMGLLEQAPDPASARSSLIRMTPDGDRVHRRALATLGVIEDVLVERLGADAVAALREALAGPWGAPPVVAAPDGGASG